VKIFLLCVPLDVVEEAKKTIENKKRERTENAASTANKKTEEPADVESTIPHIVKEVFTLSTSILLICCRE